MFGAPFFMLVGGGGSLARRAVSAGLGAAIPVGLLLAYNVATTGHVFHPAYDYLYQTEYTPRAGVPPPRLGHRGSALHPPEHRHHAALAAAGRAGPPSAPGTGRSARQPCRPALTDLFDEGCPILAPDPIGMSLLLTSPGYLLVAPLLLAAWRRRVVLAAALAVGAVALINVMHFSQGWVQFGYRFSNDYAPFALVLVTMAIARLGVRWWTVALVVASILINAWGVWWGIRLGW